MKRLTIIAFLVLVLVACAPIMPAPQVNKTEPTENKTVEEQPVPEENATVEETPKVDYKDVPKKEAVEGDLVNFPNLKAVDPDGDPIKYTFTSPLNEKGEWQTEVGDAGEHLITITASDGVNTVSQQVLILIKPKNQAPTIEVQEPIETSEGETLVLSPTVTDPDGDTVNVSYSGWTESDTKEVGYDESGLHKVVISATDGKATTTKEIIVAVKNVNRAPVLKDLAPIQIKEGQKVTVRVDAEDPDGDKVTLTYDFPLGENGTWQTEIGDAGEYELLVTASDGELTAEATAMLTVEAVNRPPVIELEDTISVKEGDLVTLEPVVTDPEGDEFRISYSGWMNSNTKQTDYEDSGDHTVRVSARDTAGNEAEFEVTIIVQDNNRPPIFGAGSFN